MTLIEKVVQSHPKLARGRVWCRVCGSEQRVNPAQCLSTGWLKCCGYTMTIDSPDEQEVADERRG